MFVKKWPLEYQKVLKPTFLPTYETVVTVVTIDCLQTVLSLYIDDRRGVQENTSIRSREFPLVTFFNNFLLSHKVVQQRFCCQQFYFSQDISYIYFLAALSSSRSLVVGPSVRWSVGQSVRVCLWKSDLVSEWVSDLVSEWPCEWVSDSNVVTQFLWLKFCDSNFVSFLS